jgi:hypothetical protein
MLAVATVASVAIVPAAASDVVALKSGRLFSGEVVYIEDDQVRFRRVVSGERGAGSAVVNIPAGQIDYIDFGRSDAESAVLTDPSSVPLDDHRRLWAEAALRLHQAKSAGGEIGLALGERLLASDRPGDRDDALAVFAAVEQRDWNEGRRTRARAGRLRTLMATGRAAEALGEAEEVSRSSEDPGLVIEAMHLLASSDLEALRAIDADNPKWAEDDEVRPRREALFHQAVDRFLFAFLFHGSEEEAAARGLWGAHETYAQSGHAREAGVCAEDILTHYPHSRFAALARGAPGSPGPAGAGAAAGTDPKEPDHDDTSTNQTSP